MAQETFERSSSISFDSTLPKEMSNFRELLIDLYSLTNSGNTSELRRLLWPLQKNKTEEIIEKLE